MGRPTTTTTTAAATSIKGRPAVVKTNRQKVRKAEKILIGCLVVAVSTTQISLLLSTTTESQSSSFGHPHLTVVPAKTQTQRSQQQEQWPTLTLHVGPPKTATTSIQCGLHHWSEELAVEDSIYYIGKPCPRTGPLPNNETTLNGHKLLMCLIDGNTHCGGYDEFHKRLQRHKSVNHDVVYSNEGFANHLVDEDVAWDALKSLLKGWNVRIVIGYRHYFEWIRSLYYQQTLNKKFYKLNWPGQNGVGRSHPSFLTYLDYHLTRYETNDLSVDGGHSAHSYGHHLTLSTYKKYAKHFQDIQVLDLYTTTTATTDKTTIDNSIGIITQFVCHMIPNTIKTCERIKKDWTDSKAITSSNTAAGADATDNSHSNTSPGGTSTTIQRRASKSFDAQRIAEAAYEIGYIDKSMSKEKIVKQIEKELSRRGMDNNSPTQLHDFLSCPSQSLEQRLIDASIQFEKNIRDLTAQSSNSIFNDDDWETVRQRHLSLFENAKGDRRFCEVDTEKLLHEKEWGTFLQQIGKVSES
mmetsp:Transcript_32718/g.79509  ORF Transcript_32718/g.79509 Transcript_32718/m.79509 type:complete len:523 (-) Transcript_32718:307-1875(-)